MNQIVKEIESLKKEKDAVILAHYYLPDEIQDIADYVGDSFYLSETATKVDAKRIVLCGVKFMAESAKILNPEKIVLMPEPAADCPMAHMAQVEKIKEVKQQHPEAAVVCYVNSSAELKANSDVCVTSSNALKIVRALPNKKIFFVPDENLGRFIADKCPDKEFIFNDGYCHVHADVTKEMLMEAKSQHPNAKVLVHPECKPEISAMADYAGSTAGIIKMAGEFEEDELIIGTEIGVLYEMKRKYPHKTFFNAGKEQVCPDMKLITLEKVLNVLKSDESAVQMSASLLERAKSPLSRMLELS